MRLLPPEVVRGVHVLGARLLGRVAAGLRAELVPREPAEDVVEEVRARDLLHAAADRLREGDVDRVALLLVAELGPIPEEPRDPRGVELPRLHVDERLLAREPVHRQAVEVAASGHELGEPLGEPLAGPLVGVEVEDPVARRVLEARVLLPPEVAVPGALDVAFTSGCARATASVASFEPPSTTTTSCAWGRGSIRTRNVSVKPPGMSTLSRNSGYGHVNVWVPFDSDSGWIENPCRWKGWWAWVVFVNDSSSVSPGFA